jgi:hypothetical protein
MGGNRSIPLIDDEGFATRAGLLEKALTQSIDDFTRVFNVPGLLVINSTGQSSPPDSSTERSASGSKLLFLTEAGSSSAAARRYLNRVGFLTKRPGNPFPAMISIGRAPTNDITIALDTISKLHGYFLLEAEGWLYTDYQSTNGTLVNGARLAKGEKKLLKDNDRFQIGLDIVATYLGPQKLYETLRGRTP